MNLPLATALFAGNRSSRPRRKPLAPGPLLGRAGVILPVVAWMTWISLEAAQPAKPDLVPPSTHPASAPTNAGPALATVTNDSARSASATVTHAALTGTNAGAPGTQSLSAVTVPAKNLRPVLGDPVESARAQTEQFQKRLDLARRLRQEHDSAGTEKNCVWLLESSAPEEFKRAALLELADLAQDAGELSKAQQILAQYINRFPEDSSVPQIYLRQGLLYRQLGVPTLALSKFYAVMSTALNLKVDRFEDYQRLVLQAQTEIADIYYLQGKFNEAADYFSRLLKLNGVELNKTHIHYKLVRALSAMARNIEVVGQAQLFLDRYPETTEVPEVRFLYADSLRKLGRNREAMQQVLTLLQSQQAVAAQHPETWVYWQQRTGNDIANQLYKEGDYINALEIYLNLARLHDSPAWQWPAWYQIGLIYERLLQPKMADEAYGQILARESALGTSAPNPSLTIVLDMAKWRKKNLQWQDQADAVNRNLSSALLNEKRASP